MSLARKFGCRKPSANRVSKTTFSSRPTKSPKPSLDTVETVMSHTAALQGAPMAEMAAIPVWVSSLGQALMQMRMFFHLRKKYFCSGATHTPDAKELSILKNREASIHSILFFLQYDFPRASELERVSDLKKAKIDQALKLFKDAREEAFMPKEIADQCAEIFEMFEEQNWGAQEAPDDDISDEDPPEQAVTTSGSGGRPSASRVEDAEGTVLNQLPKTNDPIWGLHGMMHGLMLAGKVRKSYRFDPRYISEKRDAKVFGNNRHTPGDWWPLVHVALFHGAHGEKMKGISGDPDLGAYSIMIKTKGQYETLDSDEGETVFYSGDRPGNKNNRDEILEVSRRTKSLQTSRRTGKPVRVLRGSGNGKYAPVVGIRYDGLYRVVEEYEKERPGRGGKFLQFKLVRIPGQRDFKETVRSAPTSQQQAAFYQMQRTTTH
ncbi:PUA-like domain-containing protein [Podospora conica]|nr:PUA-like domain-containing protein [Schizothecium conicum]